MTQTRNPSSTPNLPLKPQQDVPFSLPPTHQHPQNPNLTDQNYFSELSSDHHKPTSTTRKPQLLNQNRQTNLDSAPTVYVSNCFHQLVYDSACAHSSTTLGCESLPLSADRHRRLQPCKKLMRRLPFPGFRNSTNSSSLTHSTPHILCSIQTISATSTIC